jgi:hypothetical protein
MEENFQGKHLENVCSYSSLALSSHNHVLAYVKDKFSLKEGISPVKGSRPKNYKHIMLFVSAVISFLYEMRGSDGNGSLAGVMLYTSV